MYFEVDYEIRRGYSQLQQIGFHTQRFFLNSTSEHGNKVSKLFFQLREDKCVLMTKTIVTLIYYNIMTEGSALI
jgi:hypothetical protein